MVKRQKRILCILKTKTNQLKNNRFVSNFSKLDFKYIVEHTYVQLHKMLNVLNVEMINYRKKGKLNAGFKIKTLSN